MSNIEVLKFNISAATANFNIPISNDKKYTNMHIHKLCVLGILGGIIGIVENPNIKDVEANYYNLLKNLKISIVPSNPTFPKFISKKTNTTGHFNKNSVYINEIEMLLNPSWDIYIKSDNSDEYEKIKDFLLNGKSYIRPYLGTNWNFADISNVKTLTGTETNLKELKQIDSLFIINEDFIFEDEDTFNFKEHMPIKYECLKLKDISNNKEFQLWQYVYENVCYTDDTIYNNKDVYLIKCNDKSLYFI